MADEEDDLFGEDIYGAAPTAFGEGGGGGGGDAGTAPAAAPAAPAPPAPAPASTYFAPAYPPVRNAVAEGAAAAELLDLNEK